MNNNQGNYILLGKFLRSLVNKGLREIRMSSIPNTPCNIVMSSKFLFLSNQILQDTTIYKMIMFPIYLYTKLQNTSMKLKGGRVLYLLRAVEEWKAPPLFHVHLMNSSIEVKC